MCVNHRFHSWNASKSLYNYLTHRINCLAFFSVDGKFTEWAAWGECSKTCGEGKKQRKRYCTAPKPAFGGKACAVHKLSDTVESTSCNLGSCPSMFIVL